MTAANNGKTNKADKADVVFAVIILVFSAVIYWQTLDLPPPRYEPLGSAAVPQALCIIMSLLALVVLIRALPRLRNAVKTTSTAETTDFIRCPWLATGSFILVAAYVAAMDLKWLAFIPATIAFLVVLGLLLTRGDWRQLPWVVGFSCVLTLTCHLIFTKVFYIDLP